MIFFRDIIVAAMIMGVWTRISNWLLRKKVSTMTASYLSFWIALIIMIPFISWIAGFDLLVAEYVIALIIWLLIDLIWNRIRESNPK